MNATMNDGEHFVLVSSGHALESADVLVEVLVRIVITKVLLSQAAKEDMLYAWKELASFGPSQASINSWGNFLTNARNVLREGAESKASLSLIRSDSRSEERSLLHFASAASLSGTTAAAERALSASAASSQKTLQDPM